MREGSIIEQEDQVYFIFIAIILSWYFCILIYFHIKYGCVYFIFLFDSPKYVHNRVNTIPWRSIIIFIIALAQTLNSQQP